MSDEFPSVKSIHKLLREDLPKLEVSIREDLHRVEVSLSGDLRELSTQARGILSTIRILAVLAITSLAASIWWGSTLTADLRSQGSRLDRIEAAIAKLAEKR
jgi:hypothetical protein